MKVLSFVIPAYNCEQFLEKCISSMLVPELCSQLEIIVVNDGSSDGTAAVAESYCVQYPKTVRLISQKNRGHGGALNTGCAAAQGKYLKVIDADDWVVTENLVEFVKLLEQCESDVVLTHHHTIDVGTGEIKKWKSYPAEFGKTHNFSEIMSDWEGFNWSLTFHGITYKTEFYRKFGHGLLEYVFYEDHEYATYPCCYAGSVTPFDLFIYEYRIGDVNQSVSNANQLKRIGHIEAVLRKMIQEYRKVPESVGRQYAAMKIQGVLLSYLTTALLVNPDKKTGRRMARDRMEECRTDIPEVYILVRKKYQIFYLMNLLCIGKAVWDKLVNSRFYNRMRNRHSFE